MEESVLANTLTGNGDTSRVDVISKMDGQATESNVYTNIERVESGQVDLTGQVDLNNVGDAAQEEAHDTNFLLAKEYLDDALSNRHINFIPTAYNVKLYSCYKRKSLIFLCYFFYFLNVSLALFEKPNVPSLGVPYLSLIHI